MAKSVASMSKGVEVSHLGTFLNSGPNPKLQILIRDVQFGRLCMIEWNIAGGYPYVEEEH